MPQESVAREPSVRRGASKATLVHDDLHSAIVTLALKPGARINKDELCERLGVSRQPLAEALARLAEEGLVAVLPQKGTYVSRLHLSDVLEAAFVRRAIEVATVEAITPNVSQSVLEGFERNIAYQATALRAKDAEGFYALDLRFHAIIFEAIAMRKAMEVAERSRAQLERARRLFLPAPGRMQATLREHRAIFSALKARDAGAATAAMAAHLDFIPTEVTRLARERPDLFAS